MVCAGYCHQHHSGIGSGACHDGQRASAGNHGGCGRHGAAACGIGALRGPRRDCCPRLGGPGGDHGRIDHTARKRNKISVADMREALRQKGIDGEARADNVKDMTLEPSGKISVIKIDPCKPDRS